MSVHDELDSAIKEVIVKLVDASPPPPPFPRQLDERLRSGSGADRIRRRLRRPPTSGLIVTLAIAAVVIAVFVAPLPQLHLFGPARPTGRPTNTSNTPDHQKVPIEHQLAELKGSDTVAGDNLGGFGGTSVAVSGTEAVVTATGGIGTTYIFTDTAGGWKQAAELKSPRNLANACLGYSATISGTTAVVGAPCYAGDTGRALVFTKTAAGWKQAAELTGSDTAEGDMFGVSVAISGSTLVVGAHEHATEAGRAYIFAHTVRGWKQTAELQGSGIAGDQFGESAAISGRTIVIGASSLASFGAAYVYTKTGAGWAKTGELIGSDTVIGDLFGWVVAISGSTVVVGAPNHANDTGRIYMFAQSKDGWKQTAELTGSDRHDMFGESVAISGGSAIAGAPVATQGASPAGIRPGEAYLFTETAGRWEKTAELQGSDSTGGDQFGSAVAISGSTAFVVAPDHAKGAGRAYVFHA